MNKSKIYALLLAALPFTALANNNDSTWGKIDYKGKPWVTNMSRPITPSQGLFGRHIALWASHGRYYDTKKGIWRWQRPQMYGTCEDLLTSSIVLPYLMPMLENAGAVVVYPRERDTQRNEIIIDNDSRDAGSLYLEVNVKRSWKDAETLGFAQHKGNYKDNENPFEAGTTRKAKTVKRKKKNYSIISYQPNFEKEGRYAVYVSYPTLENSVDDATYTVWHKGEKTEFHVNQRMGGGTWVYLGTFDFDKGSDEYNRVTLTNKSNRRGYVTADAVRFGGGMGNIVRGGQTSGMARYMEGARYYAQWAGMPYSVYSTRKGTDDYADDINTRSLMENYIGGGSCYMPNKDGLRVPIELSLAVHSDAGFSANPDSIIGSLAISTTNFNDGKLDAGISRQASTNFAAMLLNNINDDMQKACGKWAKRSLYDKNYSETRLPAVPSAIIETLAHQNFADMRVMHDPNMKFYIARSLYKTILKYTAKMHGQRYAVLPLAPKAFSVLVNTKGEAELSWAETVDPQEDTARPDGYIIYTSIDGAAFDHGQTCSSTAATMKLSPGSIYQFKITAYNKGGESFPTETLAALYNPYANKSILVVDAFDRLATPAQRNTATEQGFDFDADAGVGYGNTMSWVGRQVNYNLSKIGIEGEGGLGYTNNDFTGKIFAGNNRDNAVSHAMAIMTAKRYNISSCASDALDFPNINLAHYSAIDLAFGLQREDSLTVKPYKTFTPALQDMLTRYTRSGGKIIASGAYLGSDMLSPEDRRFMAQVLKVEHAGSYSSADDKIKGFGTSFNFYHSIGEEQHFSAPRVDEFYPIAPAFTSMLYANEGVACVAYNGKDYRSLTFGFPLECIKSKQSFAAIMRASLRFLLE